MLGTTTEDLPRRPFPPTWNRPCSGSSTISDYFHQRINLVRNLKSWFQFKGIPHISGLYHWLHSYLPLPFISGTRPAPGCRPWHRAPGSSELWPRPCLCGLARLGVGPGNPSFIQRTDTILSPSDLVSILPRVLTSLLLSLLV